MRLTSVVKFGLVLVASLLVPNSAIAQCKSEIILVPSKTKHIQGYDVQIPKGDFTSYSYQLSATDELLFVVHATSIGPHVRELLITRNRRAVQSILMRDLPELRHDTFYAENFMALTVTRACVGDAPIYFVAMGYSGDITSGDLYFTVVPADSSYKISALPLTRGGTIEISRSNPLHIRTWDNLFEGSCNACETRYLVTEFVIKDGVPIKTKHYRTHRLYTSGQFDDLRRVRFIP